MPHNSEVVGESVVRAVVREPDVDLFPDEVAAREAGQYTGHDQDITVQRATPNELGGVPPQALAASSK